MENIASSYIQDDSYVRACSNSVGYKILYGSPGQGPEHSAVIQTLADNGTRIGKDRSKWGQFALYDHLPYDSPYTAGISVWRAS